MEILWRKGEEIEVEYNGIKLSYKKWAETVYEQPSIYDSKTLEAMIFTSKKTNRPAKHHPWRSCGSTRANVHSGSCARFLSGPQAKVTSEGPDEKTCASCLEGAEKCVFYVYAKDLFYETEVRRKAVKND